MDPEKFSVFEDSINEGFTKAGEKDMTQFEVSPFVTVSIGDDIEQCMTPIRSSMAYI